MIERFRIQILAAAVGKLTSSELTLPADSYSVSVQHRCYCGGVSMTLVILPKVQVAVYKVGGG